MQKKLKVVTIGGGSSYTPELLEGFLKRYHELPVSELWLVDVEEGQEKLLVPSQLAILKVKDCTILLPEFLKISLSQKEIQEKIRRIESGTTQRVVKLGTIMELQIEVPDKETQRRVVEMDTLCRKKERMYLKLMKQERQLTEIAIRKIMGGTLR